MYKQPIDTTEMYLKHPSSMLPSSSGPSRPPAQAQMLQELLKMNRVPHDEGQLNRRARTRAFTDAFLAQQREGHRSCARQKIGRSLMIRSSSQTWCILRKFRYTYFLVCILGCVW